LPTLEELGLSFTPIDPRAAIQFKGGETEALAVESLFFETKTFCLQRNKKRNGAKITSKFLLALGCISQEQL
jgi:deoxyribodipyrimidine photo-lyase